MAAVVSSSQSGAGQAAMNTAKQQGISWNGHVRVLLADPEVGLVKQNATPLRQ